MVKIKLFVQGRGKLVGKAKDLTILTAMENTMNQFSIEVGDYVKIVCGSYVKDRIGKVTRVFSKYNWAIHVKIVERGGENSILEGYGTILEKGDYIRIHEINYPVLEHWLSGGEVVNPATNSKYLFAGVSSPKWELTGCYQIKEEKTCRSGQRFIYKETGEKYILSTVSKRLVALISLSNGFRWHDPVLVTDPLNISQREFENILNGGDARYWEEIPS